MDFFQSLKSIDASLRRLETLLSHLSDCNIPLGNQKYNFVGFSPDPEKIELYGTSEAAINHELEVTFAPKGRRDKSAPCPFELDECGPGLIAVVEVLRAALNEQPDSAILKKWVKDLSKAAEYHYKAASRQIPSDNHTQPSEKLIEVETDANDTMEAIAIDHQDYVDIPEPPKGKGGRPVDPRLLQIAIRCHKKTDAHKVTVFRCIGTAKGCTTAWKCKTRIKKRILGHAATCEHVPRQLKGELDGGLAADAPSAKVARFNANSKPSATTGKNTTKRASVQPSVEHISKKARMDQLTNQLDADIVQLFCIGGIPPSKVDLPQWKTMWRHAVPSYEPASASKLEEYLIPTEAAFVRTRQLEHLQTCNNLSITFDGETTRLPQSVYTFHVITPDRESFEFQLQLSQLLAVTGPPSKATKCLESSFATASDVYVFWLAVQASYEELFKKNVIKLPVHVLEKIRRLSNYRFNQTINSAPSDTFIVAFFLIPRYRDAAILTKINPLALVPIHINQSTLTASVDADDNSILERIGNFLVSQLQTEYESKKQKIRGQDGTLALAKLNEQILAYSKGAWPFNRPLSDDTNILKYWTDFLDHDNADILAFFAVKIFSITVNSMADERTASTITWLNSALRNRQKSVTLINQVQIRQWYTMSPENNKRPRPKPTVKFRDLEETIFGQEIDNNAENLETEAGDQSEDSDTWLDNSTIEFSDAEDESHYMCCSTQVFLGSKDARLDAPELLDLLSDRSIMIGAQNQSQVPSPSSIVAAGDPVAWKFSFS